MATLTLTYGDDPAAWKTHRQLLAAVTGPVERLDLAEPDGLQLLREALASAGGLFTATRSVDVRGIDTLTAADARELVAACANTATDVHAFHPGKLAAPVVKVLAGVFTVSRHEVPKPGQLPAHIRRTAAEAGVALDNAAATLAARRAGHQLDRLAVLFTALGSAGIVTLDTRQLDVLLGTTDAPGTACTVTDHIEAHRTGDALTAASRVDAQAALVWAARRAVQIAHAAELSAESRDLAELGLPDWQRERLARVAGSDPQARYRTLVASVRACAAARGEVAAADALTGLTASASRR